MPKREYHPFTSILASDRVSKDDEDYLSKQQQYDICYQYLEEKAANDYCKDRKRNIILKCSCLKVLHGNDECLEAVTLYMLGFIKRKYTERMKIVVDWVRYARDPSKNDSTVNFSTQRKNYFHIPFDADTDDDWRVELGNHKICKSALGLILDIGPGRWKTIQDHVVNNTTPIHGSKGQQSQKAWAFEQDVKKDLLEFLKYMTQLAQPRSTKVVRTETGLETLTFDEDETHLLDLPSNLSKRSLYQRFLKERGWKARCLPDGTFAMESLVDEPKPACSWSTFLKYWRVEFPNLRVQRPSEDTCDKCYEFFHRFRRLRAMQCQPVHDEEADEEDPETVADEAPVIPLGTICIIKRKIEAKEAKNSKKRKRKTVNVDGKVVGLPQAPSIYFKVKFADSETPEEFTRSELIKLIPSWHIVRVTEKETVRPSEVKDKREELLAEASLHVKQADGQRTFNNVKRDQAILDAKNGVKHEDRTYCLIADYSQSEQLPYFGQEQPGESYYYSPLKIHIFGIVDCSVEGGRLSAHVYKEGDGDKGGNNVASLLLKELKKKEWLKEGNPGKELVICMDNCTGQNKNTHVLRLACYLVEMGFFKTVAFQFYIVGHTKNACDRWFNTLKKVYRKSNVYTFDQLIDVYKSHEEIKVHRVNEGDFVQFKEYSDNFYRGFKQNTIKANHIFTVSAESPTKMKIQRDCLDGSPSLVWDFAPKKLPGRAQQMKSTPMEVEKGKGIPWIKQVELYQKFRPLIPQQYRDLTCGYPGDEIVKQIRTTKADKAREKARKKPKLAHERSPIDGIVPSDDKDISVAADGQQSAFL